MRRGVCSCRQLTCPIIIPVRHCDCVIVRQGGGSRRNRRARPTGVACTVDVNARLDSLHVTQGSGSTALKNVWRRVRQGLVTSSINVDSRDESWHIRHGGRGPLRKNVRWRGSEALGNGRGEVQLQLQLSTSSGAEIAHAEVVPQGPARSVEIDVVTEVIHSGAHG